MRLKTLLLLLFVPVMAHAQGAHRLSQIITRNQGVQAQVEPNAKITVCAPATGCAQHVTVYSDIALTQPATNPVTADVNGNFGYYIAAGCYDEKYTYPGANPQMVYNVCLGSAAGTQTVIEVNGVATSPVSPVNFVDSATVTFTRSGATISATAAGGGGGCTPPGTNFALFSTGSGGCSGTVNATLNSSGFLYINPAGGTGSIEVDAPNNPSTSRDQTVLDGQSIIVQSSGGGFPGFGSNLDGITVKQSDINYTGGLQGLFAFDAQFSVNRAAKYGIGYNSEPAVGSVTAKEITQFQATDPTTGVGSHIQNRYDFHSTTDGNPTGLTTVEQFTFFSDVRSFSNPVASNLCDFYGRQTDGTSISPIVTLRESIGCGATRASTLNGPLTLATITGSIQCLHVNSSGLITGTGADCGAGGGGTPGGSNTQIQYNNAGSFGGDSGFTTDGAGHETMKSLAVADGTGNAGLVALKQGTSAGTVTNAIGFTAPTSVVAYNMTWPGAQWTGLLSNNGSGVLSGVAILPVANGGTGTSTPALVNGTGITITGSWPNQTVSSTGTGGSSTVASAEVVSFSATPTFSVAFNVSRISLTGNITSFTLGAGSDGQLKTLCFAQGAGPYSVLPPTNVHGFFTVGTTNGAWNCQNFSYDNTDSIWLANSLGVQNE